MNRKEILPAGSVLPIMIGSALLLQMTGRYHAHDFAIGHFYYGWLVLRIVVPGIILRLVAAPISEIGLGLPASDRFLRLLGIIAVIGLLVIYVILRFSPEYLGHYTKAFGGTSGARLANFLVFTLSTLTGWEFLHRSFLLMATVYFLQKEHRLKRGTARMLAVMMVWIFEVMFHLVKPPLEALGMLLGSPVLSYVTLRTGSIWPAFTIHLGVEAIFILALM